MKKIWRIVLVVACLCCLIKCQANINTAEPVPTENAVFRNVVFGMTMEQVQAAEKEKLLQGENLLAIDSCQIAGVDTAIVYDFNDNGELYRISGMDNEIHYTDNEYIKEYEAYVKALTEKYGEPTDVKEVWLDDLFRDDPEDKGLAISLGHFTSGTFWTLEEYEVMGVIGGSDYEITVGFNLTSNEFEEATTSSGM